MEIFLEEHGESILYGIIGIIMVLAVCVVINKGILIRLPDYKNEVSLNNKKHIEKLKDKGPKIIADEVIYAEFDNEKFNCMDYIKAIDYEGNDISDKMVVYGNYDIHKKGLYKLKCKVVAGHNLACVKYVNIIVE